MARPELPALCEQSRLAIRVLGIATVRPLQPRNRVEAVEFRRSIPVRHQNEQIATRACNQRARPLCSQIADERKPRDERIMPPVSTATGGPMPGIDLADLSDLQEMEDLDYVRRMQRFK